MARQKSSGTLRALLGAKLPGATSASGRSWSSKLRAMGSGKLRDMYKAMGGASGKEAEAAGGAPAEGDSDFTAELRGLLRELKLEAKLADAQAWCADEEVESLAELARTVKDRAFADSLIARLQIRPGKAKARNLLEVIAERARAQQAEPAKSGRAPHINRQVSDQI